MKDVLKKFFSAVKEWFADCWDEFRLWITERRIVDLYGELDLNDEYDTRLEIKEQQEKHKTIFARINKRELAKYQAKQKRAVAS